MEQLEDWIEATFEWLASPDERERQSAILRNEQLGPLLQFTAPRELEWPLLLLQNCLNLRSYFAQSRDIDLITKRVDQIIDNLAVWIQQYQQKLRQSKSISKDDRHAFNENRG